MNLFETIAYYFTFPFVRYAMIAGVFIALSASLLGVTLVLKRFSFIGDGLSHVAFGAMCIASILKFTNNIPFVLLITILTAVLILWGGKKVRIKGDAMIAMISVASLAIGYLLINLFKPNNPNLSADVCSTLFGSTSILTLSVGDVILCGALSGVVVLVFIFFYHKLFAITFDENFAQATGTKVRLYNLFLAIIIAVIIVLAMNLVGSLLISALIVFPALSAMRVFKTFRSVTVCSAALGVFSAASGILVSIVAGTPVGSTIVVANLLVFFLFMIVGLFAGRGRA